VTAPATGSEDTGLPDETLQPERQPAGDLIAPTGANGPIIVEAVDGTILAELPTEPE
jgi:hypothetical protein